MGKLWSATSLVALTLLSCLAGTEVEAQDWQNRQLLKSSAAKLLEGNSQPAPRTTQAHMHGPHSGDANVLSHQDLNIPHYSLWPDLPPIYSNWPQQWQDDSTAWTLKNPPPPKSPSGSDTHRPNPPSSSKWPHVPDTHGPKHPPPLKWPPVSDSHGSRHPPPLKWPPVPDTHKPKHPPPVKWPPVIAPLPPQVPSSPNQPPVIPPQPPQVPSSPNQPPVIPPQPPQVPSSPNQPPVIPPQPPQVPSSPNQPPVIVPQPPQVPSSPNQPPVIVPQSPQVPSSPNQPPVTVPQPPPVSSSPNQPPVIVPQPAPGSSHPIWPPPGTSHHIWPPVTAPQPPPAPSHPIWPPPGHSHHIWPPVIAPQPGPSPPKWPPVTAPQPPQVPSSPNQPPVTAPQPPPAPSHPIWPPPGHTHPIWPPVTDPQPGPLPPLWPPVTAPQPGPLPPLWPPVTAPQPGPLPPLWPPVTAPQPPQVPSSPNQPPVTAPQPPQVPSPPNQPPVTAPQPPQVPSSPNQPPVTAPQPPVIVPQTPQIVPTVQPTIQSCNVVNSLRVPCGVPYITAHACQANGCCFDGQQCYYGKAVTVQCTKDAQFIVVVARDATLPNIDLASISLLGSGPNCTNVDSNSGFAIYQFPVTACGTTVTEAPGVISYVNKMTSTYTVEVGPYGSITRDSSFELIFQCMYIGTAVTTVFTVVKPSIDPPLPVAALGPITVQLRLANGHCTTKGCNEVDVAYNSYYANTDYPVIKVLRDPVYVEVQLTEKTDPNLILTLGRCWTTTSPMPHSMPQWDILINGCPNQNDWYKSSLVAVDASSGVDFPTHYRRFIFQMFAFVNPGANVPLKENVYIHCSTAVCTATPGRSCEPTCARKKRHATAENRENADPKIVVSAGPVAMEAPGK